MKRRMARFPVIYYATLLGSFFVCVCLNASGQTLINRNAVRNQTPAGADDVKGKVGSLTTIVNPTEFATEAELLSLGAVWQVTEADGWTGTWTRRAGKNIFDAKWRHRNGTTAQDVITLVSWSKTTGKITLKRQAFAGEYRGILNVQNRKIIQGTTTWYTSGQTWNASY